jgi:hypothetical protein
LGLYSRPFGEVDSTYMTISDELLFVSFFLNEKF